MKIQGAIFDLDGTLINSEPLWQDAEIKIFAQEDLHITREQCALTKGIPSLEAVKLWYDKMPAPSRTIEELNEALNEEVLSLIREKGKLKDGVTEVLDLLKKKSISMGIASSSRLKLIETVVDKCNLHTYFDVIHSAEFEEYGKPHPVIYLSTARMMNIDPVFTIAFEDSLPGAISAKAARMKTVMLLDEGQYHDTTFDFTDLKLESFHNFGPSELDYLYSLL